MNFEEKTLSSQSIYNGRIIKVEELTVELPDGKKAKREIVRHPGAAAVIPVNEKGEMYMVSQYRKPLEIVSLEIPAGKLDPGEPHNICAERELKEETGLVAEKLQHVVSIHSTPGFSDETLHIYLATGLKQEDSCADEDEFLSCEKIPVQKLVQKVLDREITDAKSIIGILLAEKYLKGELKI